MQTRRGGEGEGEHTAALLMQLVKKSISQGRGRGEGGISIAARVCPEFRIGHSDFLNGNTLGPRLLGCSCVCAFCSFVRSLACRIL